VNKIVRIATPIALAGGLVLVAATESQAAPSLRVRAKDVAEKQIGKPYQWGAAGPRRFDCSGLVQYSFKRVGKKIPRTAQAQYRYAKHVNGHRVTVGDEVFIHDRHGVYHVGIYVGHWKGKSWMVNANSGRTTKHEVMIAPISNYTGHGSWGSFGRIS
jgi:cell wall-associated NlpC family hydrolase